MDADSWVERAEQGYQRAVFAGDSAALEDAEHELDAVEADLALARGRLLHVRFFDEPLENPHELELFERALELYRRLGDQHGEASALFWVGCFHQVVRHDLETAEPLFEMSYELAARTGDTATQTEALRHLGIVAHAAGQLDKARANLEESTRLRREIGLLAGAAANQVGLIYIAIAQGRRDDARALADEAHAQAVACGATRIRDQIEEARAQI